ncbi:insulinase family protein [Fictibacillus sp. 5RED26]|uniref:EF-P 5-aminopentanol modification-associated protein YfmH n=1 Tax=Fictibacillus TaxID=1329200 RepID=UPI0018CD6C26|nr:MULTISPECIES: pitrilysin family protein [unclassified Fictibacillus]MBH0155949.1 insulinase family protein [Fictibacillus sp. 5RED26]MBH0165809.1 insulinase family protein [Fictibacillus sp. 7GRE50]MBH0173142.1 insulinase family protein [Fictibacillus sp. 23RED33]
MGMKTFDQLDETLHYEELPNGLKVYVLEKKGFNKTYATFTTHYGSVDNHFKPLGKDENVKVPDGIAHFLEHKLFEKEHGDVFQDFSKQGASANAFTTFNRTAYLFSTTGDVKKNLTTLIDFVQEPYFTEKTVEKEKGIIGQEIRMYDDNPDWRVYFGLIENMYHHHPVKIDIAGTEKSIAKITKDDLYECYETFYHPSNMILFIVGPIDAKEILNFVKDNQSQKSFKEKEHIERFFDEEPQTVAKSKKVIEMTVQTPKCYMGYKEATPNRQGKELMKHELSVNLLLEMMFGKSSPNYETLYEEGLIDQTFSFDYTEENGFGFSMLGGDTRSPDGFVERISGMVEAFKQQSIDEGSFNRARKKKIGAFLRSLNSPEFIANQFTRYAFNEMDLFDVIPVFESLTVPDVEEVLQNHFKKEAMTVCQVQKKKS